MAGSIQPTDLTDAATLSAELGWQANDARIPRLINLASDLARQYMNRFAPVSIEYAAGFVENVRGYQQPRIILTKTPVLTITSIAWQGFVFDPSEYTLQEPDAGFVYRQVGFPWTGLVRNGLMQEDNVPGSEDRLITVTYTGGWVTPGQIAAGGWGGPPRSLPFDLEDAVVMIARDRALHMNTDGSLVHEELGSAKAFYLPSGIQQIPPAAETILLKYKKHFVS